MNKCIFQRHVDVRSALKHTSENCLVEEINRRQKNVIRWFAKSKDDKCENCQSANSRVLFSSKLALSGEFSMCWSCFQQWHQNRCRVGPCYPAFLILFDILMFCSQVSAHPLLPHSDKCAGRTRQSFLHV